MEAGDIAFLYSRCNQTSTDAEGEPVAVSGNGIEVAQRRSDESWRCVIDDPFGGDRRKFGLENSRSG